MQREAHDERISVGSGTIERVTAILDALALHGPMNAADAANAVGLPRPTMYRTLATLENLGVVVESAGTYALGLRPRLWGERAAATAFSLDEARRVLDSLCTRTGESAQLFVREGDARVCIAVSEPAIGLRDSVPLGARLPIDRGSGGKIFQAFAPTSAPPTAERGNDKLAHIRKNGWAESVAERAVGVASVSAPVMHDGTLAAVVSVSGPTARFGQAQRVALSREVISAARELSSMDER